MSWDYEPFLSGAPGGDTACAVPTGAITLFAVLRPEGRGSDEVAAWEGARGRCAFAEVLPAPLHLPRGGPENAAWDTLLSLGGSRVGDRGSILFAFLFEVLNI